MAPDLRPIKVTTYILPKLKWYQKILQKLHIKTYWREFKVGTIEYIGEENK